MHTLTNREYNPRFSSSRNYNRVKYILNITLHLFREVKKICVKDETRITSRAVRVMAGFDGREGEGLVILDRPIC